MSDDVTRVTAQEDLQPGALFAGKYRVQRLLGKGGFGAVYLVKNEEIGWEAALKLLHPEHGADPAYRARFLREMGVARDLNHPNSVPVRDAGIEKGRLYYTMDFVPGKSLKDVIQKEGRIAAPRAAGWMKQLLSFLSFLHSKHYIHRDLKPDNLIVQVLDNGEEVLRVLDLGIAKSIAASTETQGLTGGSVIGTPHYMAPEHAAGDEIDHRIDLYATGVILYECCRAARPFQEPTLQKLFHSIRTQEAPPLPEVIPGFPEALWQVIAKALQKDRELRFRDAKEFSAALDAVLPTLTVGDGTVVQSQGTATLPVDRTQVQGGGGKGRKKLVAAVVLLVLAAAGVMFALQDRTPPAITSSEPLADAVVKVSPVAVTIYANEELSEATIGGNRATITGSEARAEVALSGESGPRSIQVELVDKGGNRTLTTLKVRWEPAPGGSGEVQLAIQRQTPLATEPQKQPFRLEILANRALGPDTRIDGRPAEVQGPKASAMISRFVGQTAGTKSVPVKLVDLADNPPKEGHVDVLWRPDPVGVQPAAKPNLPAGLVAMPNAPDDPAGSGYPTLVKHEESDIVLTLFRATGAEGFLRGKTEQNEKGVHKDHSPRHRVRINRPFYLSRSLISRQQYRVQSKTEAPDLKEYELEVAPSPDDPVTGLTWQQASSFCQKLGGRLPTEAEWEWVRQAALGEPKEPREFLWLGDLAAAKRWANTTENFSGSEKARLASVTSFPTQTLRGKLTIELYDLVGNAAEFCADAFVPYTELAEDESAPPMDDPGQGPQFGSKARVVRGASFGELPTDCQLVRRRRDSQFTTRLNEVGFRVCIPLPK